MASIPTHMPRPHALRLKVIRATVFALASVGVVIAVLMSWLYVRTADENLDLLERQIGETTTTKGTLLVENQALALRGLAEDNALSDIQSLVRRAVEQDPDVLYGLFHG